MRRTRRALAERDRRDGLALRLPPDYAPPEPPEPHKGFFIRKWRTVLKRAWSVRLVILASMLSAAEVAVPLLDGVIPVERGTFAGIAFIVTLGAGLARFVSQGIDE